jgi:hypothetical protein
VWSGGPKTSRRPAGASPRSRRAGSVIASRAERDPTGRSVECIGAVTTTTLPGLTVPRHGLGAAFVDGRAYVVLGGPRPGLTVSAVVEMLDLC